MDIAGYANRHSTGFVNVTCQTLDETQMGEMSLIDFYVFKHNI